MPKNFFHRLIALALAAWCAAFPALSQQAESVIVNRQQDAAAPWPFAENAELLEVWFPQMINCDAALLRYGDEVILIDCCSESYAKRLLVLLDGLGITHIRTIYNTHPHHDHLLGFMQVADHVQVDELAVCFPEDTNDRMKTAVAAAAERNIPVTHYGDGDIIHIGPAMLDVYQRADDDWSINNRSAMMRLKMGERTMLFTADMEKKALDRAVETIPVQELQSDILKHPHHGLTLLNDDFAGAVQPLLSIITNNTRAQKACYDLRLRKIPYIYTSSGYTHLVTDGAIWFVEVVPAEDMQAAQKAFQQDPMHTSTWIPSQPK